MNTPSNPFGGANALATAVAIFFLIPSVLFLVLYWTNMIKKYLQ